MRVGISGSRSIVDAGWVSNHLDAILPSLADRSGNGIVLMAGGAVGCDTLVQGYAQAKKLDLVLFKPYHMVDPKTPYNPKFFFARNKQIIDNSDFVIIMWDGKSSGTRWTMEYAERTKKDKMVRYLYEPKPYGMPE